jgi:hypothetical protein
VHQSESNRKIEGVSIRHDKQWIVDIDLGDGLEGCEEKMNDDTDEHKRTKKKDLIDNP